MSGNILIVDDSDIERKIIAQAIKDRLDDVNIYEARDGFDISNKLLKNNIHVCIMDIMMPVKDGFEVLQEIKDNFKLMDIPVIVCTGISDKEGIERALSLGAYDYFSKPLSEEVIKIALPLKIKNAIDFMKRKQEIIHLSYHDQLTGLYNRRFFEDELNQLDMKENLPLTIVMGDLNGLKLINDSFGHIMGDELIKRVGKVMDSVCRTEGITARISGDEFIILLPKTNELEAEKIIIRINDMLAEEKVGSSDVSISLGYGCKNNEDERIDEIIKIAENNMYERKLYEGQDMRGKTIKNIMDTFYEKNELEKGHSLRVSELCRRIGKELKLPQNKIDDLVSLGRFHDIGKIALDENIINKAGKLTEDEWKEVKRHSEIGYRMINTVDRMSSIANYILYHHERWDGTGYPKGLKEEEIPLESRIIAVVDAYDTMVSERCYKDELTEKTAIEELKNNSGSQFDPDLVKIFINEVLKYDLDN